SDGAERFTTHLASAGLFDTLLVCVEIRGRESRGLVIRAQRVVTLVAARLGDGVDDPALKIAMLRADAQAVHVQGFDPIDAQGEKVAAESRVVDGHAVDLVVVRYA